jgi:hypothetical protein
MTFPRFTLGAVSVLAAAAGLLGLSGCGGGGGGGHGTPAAAHVQGQVLSQNGSTAGLSGIQLTLLPSGRVVTTDDAGRFDFGTVPAGDVAIRVGGAGGGGGGADDPDGDDRDVGDDDADVDASRGGEVEVRLVLDGGVIAKIEVSEDGGLEAKIELARATTSDDADVVGFVKLETGDEAELRVDVENVTPGRQVEAFLVDDAGATSLGTRTADSNGRARWSFEHGTLPAGVTNLADLQGVRVEVRGVPSGPVLLSGEIPDLPPALADVDAERHGEARLTAAAGVVGTATVEVQREMEEGVADDEFEVEVEHLALPAGTTLLVRLENPSSPGTFQTVGTITVDADGRGKLKLESQEGGLPFGATSIDALVGLDVEVRNATTNDLLFSGTVPDVVED